MRSIKALTVSPIFIDENISYHKLNHQSTLKKGCYLANVYKTYLTNWFTKLGHLNEVFSSHVYFMHKCNVSRFIRLFISHFH